MPKYRVYASVTGSTYLGQFDAKSKKEAEEKAYKQSHVSLCHQCSSSCEDPVIEVTGVELVEKGDED